MLNFRKLEKMGYLKYLESNPFHLELGVDLEEYLKSTPRIHSKKSTSPYYYFNLSNISPYPPELDDLIRLHYLITSRKVTTILEFGVGFSTKVMDHAISLNKKKLGALVSANLRRSNPFELHAVDNSKKWIKETKKRYQFENSSIHYSKCVTSTFNDRICTFYKTIPNICPDFIYLDAPDQFDVNGTIRGISTRHEDRMPMAADLLAIEHFLLPGTLIAVDGRSANARFLKSNFQRNWVYTYFKNFDQHFFELNEVPLGIWNEKQLNLSRK